jgi:rhodanese-related sulfurtransferase
MKNQTLVKEICPTTTQEWIKKGALLVDVREKDEVTELAYDVPRVINIPLSVFEERFAEIPKDKEIVVVCRGGGRSLRAAGFLINNGYDKEKVVNMQYGIIRWVQKGFPTKGDTSSVLGNTQENGCCGKTSSKTTQSCCEGSPNSDGGTCC